jgi:hypothetical protein
VRPGQKSEVGTSTSVCEIRQVKLQGQTHCQLRAEAAMLRQDFEFGALYFEMNGDCNSGIYQADFLSLAGQN